MPILRVASGPHKGQQFSLVDGVVEIGRDPLLPISLSGDSGVSRKHARLEVQGSRVTVHDLGSSNGVFVNSKRTVGTLLATGDTIQIGRSVLVVEMDSASPGEQPPVGVPAGPSAGWQASTAPFPPYPAASVEGGAAGSYAPPVYAPTPGAAAVPGHAPPPAGYSPPPAGWSSAPNSSSGVPYARWLYMLAFSIPQVGFTIALFGSQAAGWILSIVGLIPGIIYLLKDTPDEKHAGRWMLFWALFGALISWIGYVETKPLLNVAMKAFSGTSALGGGSGNPLGGSGGSPLGILPKLLGQ